MAEVLTKKAALALDSYQPRSLLVAGGVAANKMIREHLVEMTRNMEVDIYLPELKYCGDNAAMIGAAAFLLPRTSIVPKSFLPPLMIN